MYHFSCKATFPSTKPTYCTHTFKVWDPFFYVNIDPIMNQTDFGALDITMCMCQNLIQRYISYFIIQKRDHKICG